jgi:hypothetical protein
MLFTPTALILADNAQQNLLNAARLDGRTTGLATQQVTTSKPASRSLRGLVLRPRTAL